MADAAFEKFFEEVNQDLDETAKTGLRGPYMEVYENHMKLGIDISGMSLEELRNPSKLFERLPQEIRSSLRLGIGPNCKEFFVHNSKQRKILQMNATQFWQGLSTRAAKIMEYWDGLQKINLEAFQEVWKSMTSEHRREWLNRKAKDKLHKHLNAPIHAWFESRNGKTPSAQQFYSPMLNLDDLTKDDNLPELLKSRANSHPTEFRTIDGRSIELGRAVGCIHDIHAQGLVSFTTGISGKIDLLDSQIRHPYDIEQRYGILFEHSTEKDIVSMRLNIDRGLPTTAFGSLLAQVHIYEILFQCVEGLLDEVEISLPMDSVSLSPRNNAKNDENPLFLARSSWLENSGSGQTIDLDYLSLLVGASLDEAQNDLWQMRQDSQFWDARLMETPDAKTAKVVGNAFRRIDMFSTICDLLHDASQVPHSTQLGNLLKNDSFLMKVASVYFVVDRFIDDQFDQLKDIKWSHYTSISPLFSCLFTFLTENKSEIRLMSLSGVLLEVERELEKAKKTIPLRVSQILSDVSVLVVCLQYTKEHFRFVSDLGQHSLQASDLADKLKNQRGPWALAAELIPPRRSSQKRETQHQFWSKFDDQLRQQSCNDKAIKDIFDEIQLNAPLPTGPQSVDELPVTSFPTGGTEQKPTQTRINRSKGKNSKERASSAGNCSHTLSNVLPSSDFPNQPCIKLTHNLDFWKKVLDPLSATTCRWEDFCAAMSGIGCELKPHGGSAVRFEWSNEKSGEKFAIVYHKPHGNGEGGKLTNRQFRSLFLNRLESRVNLVLEDA